MPNRRKTPQEQMALAMGVLENAATPFLVSDAMIDAYDSQLRQEWERNGEIAMIEYFAEEFVEGEAWYRANFGADDECIIMLDKYYDLLALGLVKDWRKPTRTPRVAKRGRGKKRPG